MARVFVLVRAIAYVSIFIGFLFVYVPASLLSDSGFVRPATIELEQVAGMLIGTAGTLIALWCILTFVIVGRGTPAPFDPPRRLVTKGPYHFVRNPMVIGAALALVGTALFYESLPLLGYAGLFILACHLFVVWYEEPILRYTFGGEYEAYCRQVRRWWPRF
jgi:protein-S-isoprenylcysteine O-methyltransferase Ste14